MKVLCVLLCLAVFYVNSVAAQAVKDVDGGSDFSFVGRYPDSFLSNNAYSDYDKYAFPLTLNSYDAPDVFERKALSGERYVKIYDVPEDVTNSLLKVYRSLVIGLEKQGFKASIDCSDVDKGCGYFFPRHLFGDTAIRAYYRYHFKEFNNLSDVSNLIYSGVLEKEGDRYYLTMVVAKSSYSSFIQYSLDVLKETALSTEELVLNVNDMADDLSNEGKVILTGLFFEHDSAQITSASEASLQTIAQYIKSKPNQKFLIVGHTDTVGSYAYNEKLSSDRAQAVLDSLVKNYGITSSALKAVGASFNSPNTSNSSENGRANNRRVELVEVMHF